MQYKSSQQHNKGEKHPEKDKSSNLPFNLSKTALENIIKAAIAIAVTVVVLVICFSVSKLKEQKTAEPVYDEPPAIAEIEETPEPTEAPEPTATPESTPEPTPEPTPTPTESPKISGQLPQVTPEFLPKTEGCQQLVLVDTTGSNASFTYYEKEDENWYLVLTCGATLGKNGVSENKKEGDKTTPAGEYPLLFVYADAKPITQMPFHKLSSDSVWVDDPRSNYYNTLQSTSLPERDWSSAEHIYDRYFKGGTHKACIYVGYNGDGLTPGSATAGRGSMITICGKTDSLSPTAGCIDIFNTDMVKLLQYLDPAKNPVVIID